MENHFNAAEEISALNKRINSLNKTVEQLNRLVQGTKEVLTLEEAAMFLGVTKSTLYKMTHKLAVPFYKPNNKMVYFERSEMLAWLRQNPVASISQICQMAEEKLHDLANSELN